MRSPHEFNLGIGEVRDGVLYSIHFSIEQIRHFLNSERHKDFIVIWFEKPIMWGGPIQETIQRLEPEFRKMGYKRILFLGGHCCGVHVLKDVIAHYPYSNILLPRVWKPMAQEN
ncbi:MAG: hypothetical protein EHM45_20045 [Desulfobacteraceae bacterium]|nr:MAG: hypothetical protein EHM45_20045 [Desulfobacteraceae bacterium]